MHFSCEIQPPMDPTGVCSLPPTGEGAQGAVQEWAQGAGVHVYASGTA